MSLKEWIDLTPMKLFIMYHSGEDRCLPWCPMKWRLGGRGNVFSLFRSPPSIWNSLSKALVLFCFLSSRPLCKRLPFCVTVLILSNAPALLPGSGYLQPSAGLPCLYECLWYPPPHQATAFSSLPSRFPASSLTTLRHWMVKLLPPICSCTYLGFLSGGQRCSCLSSLPTIPHPPDTRVISTSRFGCLVLGTKPKAWHCYAHRLPLSCFSRTDFTVLGSLIPFRFSDWHSLVILEIA